MAGISVQEDRQINLSLESRIEFDSKIRRVMFARDVAYVVQEDNDSLPEEVDITVTPIGAFHDIDFFKVFGVYSDTTFEPTFARTNDREYILGLHNNIAVAKNGQILRVVDINGLAMECGMPKPGKLDKTVEELGFNTEDSTALAITSDMNSVFVTVSPYSVLRFNSDLRLEEIFNYPRPEFVQRITSEQDCCHWLTRMTNSIWVYRDGRLEEKRIPADIAKRIRRDGFNLSKTARDLEKYFPGGTSEGELGLNQAIYDGKQWCFIDSNFLLRRLDASTTPLAWLSYNHDLRGNKSSCHNDKYLFIGCEFAENDHRLYVLENGNVKGYHQMETPINLVEMYKDKLVVVTNNELQLFGLEDIAG